MFSKKDLLTLFKDKQVFSTAYIPGNILIRDAEVQKIKDIAFLPLLKQQPTNNIFIYGIHGTGKTLSALHLVNKLDEFSQENNVNGYKILHIDCTDFPSEYSTAQQIAKQLSEKEFPERGLQLKDFYLMIAKEIKKKKMNTLIILDEVDKVMNKERNDGLLLNLIKLNETQFVRKHNEGFKGHIGLICITNDKRIYKLIDNKTKDRLQFREITFSSYNADELGLILRDRIEIGYKDGVIDESAIMLSAAIAAQENGSARYALNMIKVAGEIAERNSLKKITDAEVGKAKEEVETRSIYSDLIAIPEHNRLVYYSIYLLLYHEGNIYGEYVNTSSIYDRYVAVCKKLDKNPVSSRWLRTILANLEDLDLIRTSIDPKSRGKAKLTTLTSDLDNVDKTIRRLALEEKLY